MRKVGRERQPLTDVEIQMVREYLETRKTLKEVSEAYGISDAGLRYKIKKYKQEQEEKKIEKQ